MSAKLLEGGPIADKIKQAVAEMVADLPEDKRPKLVAVMVGDNPGARAYAKMQAKAADGAGIAYELAQMPEETTEEQLVAELIELNRDKAVTGIILQMPVPQHLNARAMQALIDPRRDVDGVNPANLGAVVHGSQDMAPCTAQAVMELVQASGLKVYGAECVVVGHSEIVGKPVALLLLDQFGTTAVCHIATSEAGRLEEHTKRADLLIVAVGVAGLIKGDMIKPGAVVIDVGMNRVKGPDGKSRMVGDVDFDSAVEVASQITPVPGGVGPLTVAILLRNTMHALYLQTGLGR